MAAIYLEWAKQALGARIRQVREDQGLTQERLALESEIDRTFISQIERGVGNPSFTTLWKIANRLNVPISLLVGG